MPGLTSIKMFTDVLIRRKEKECIFYLLYMCINRCPCAIHKKYYIFVVILTHFFTFYRTIYSATFYVVPKQKQKQNKSEFDSK